MAKSAPVVARIAGSPGLANSNTIVPSATSPRLSFALTGFSRTTTSLPPRRHAPLQPGVREGVRIDDVLRRLAPGQGDDGPASPLAVATDALVRPGQGVRRQDHVRQ